MPKVTRERRLSDQMAAGLDSLDFEPAWTVTAFSMHPTSIHRNLFDLILNFLHKWAGLYRNGDVDPSEGMYTICQMSYVMTESLNESTPTGRHHAGT